MKYLAYIREWLASLLSCLGFSSSSPTSLTQDLKSEVSLVSSATNTPYLDDKPVEPVPEFFSPSHSGHLPRMSSPGLPRQPPLANLAGQPARPAPPPPPCLNWDPHPRMKLFVDLASIEARHINGRFWFWEECQNEDDGCKNWVWVRGSACHECKVRRPNGG